MLAYLRGRAIDGVERVDGERYVRSVAHDGNVGTVEIVHVPERESLAASTRRVSGAERCTDGAATAQVLS